MERIEVFEVDGDLGAGGSLRMDRESLPEDRAVRVSVDNLKGVCVLKPEKRRRHRQVHTMTIQEVQKDTFRLPMVARGERPKGVQGVSQLLGELDVPRDLPQHDFVDGLL